MASLKKHIDLKCKDCTYDSTQSGSWRHQTEACNVKTCPLWEVRPLTTETIVARRGIKGGVNSALTALIDSLEDEDSEDSATPVV